MIEGWGFLQGGWWGDDNVPAFILGARHARALAGLSGSLRTKSHRLAHSGGVTILVVGLLLLVLGIGALGTVGLIMSLSVIGSDHNYPSSGPGGLIVILLLALVSLGVAMTTVGGRLTRTERTTS